MTPDATAVAVMVMEPVAAEIARDAAKTIAFFAPAGYDPDPARLVAARAYFEARGYRVVERLTAGSHHERFSGTDAERMEWLAAVCRDPDPGIAMALRGGYGATRLLPGIDFAAMAAAVRRGKRFVGLSDFTAIELGLLAQTGAISLAGPMASFAFGRGAVDPFTEAHFWRAIDASRVDIEFPTPFDGSTSARGIFWGGNLAMLTSLVGTPWMPSIDGGILFVEDINEQPYRIERMLMQLKQAGILDRQQMVLCGDFLDYRVTPYDDGYDIAAALARVQEATPVPIVGGLPFGHGSATLTLAVGATAEVSVSEGEVRLRQHWTL
jgi:muramoyltetrapeptide carboxypeptidase